MSRPIAGILYFVRCAGSGLVKIGYTRNPSERFSSLGFMSGSQIHVVAVRSGSWSAEKEMHRKHVTLRHHGEWFKLPLEEAWAYHDPSLDRFLGDPLGPVADAFVGFPCCCGASRCFGCFLVERATGRAANTELAEGLATLREGGSPPDLHLRKNEKVRKRGRPRSKKSRAFYGGRFLLGYPHSRKETA